MPCYNVGVNEIARACVSEKTRKKLGGRNSVGHLFNLFIPP